MASGAWKKPLNLAKKNDDKSFPGLKPAPVEPGAQTIKYAELQRDELMALEAIYGEDFVRHQDGQAWQKSEPVFDIRIRASSDEEIGVTLGVVLTATYPKSQPRLTLKTLADTELRDSTLFKIQKYLETKPKEYLAAEEPMIDGIVEGIRDILEDAARAKAAGRELPSLEEERARHEAFLAEQAAAQKAEEESKREAASKEEELALNRMLQDELKRQQEKRKQQKGAGGTTHQPEDNLPVADPGRIFFDQPCKVTDKTGNAVYFTAVTGKTELRRGALTVIYTVRPVLTDGQATSPLILKEASLRSAGKDLVQFDERVRGLESLLESLKKVRHRNLLDILDFKIDRETISNGAGSSTKRPSSQWTVCILSPEAEKGPLEELLELAGTLDINKVRSWTRDLLDAMNFLHNKSLVHQSIHPGNILLFRESSGNIVPKLSDGMYQKELHNICMGSQVTPGLSSAKSAYWLPPEIAAATKPHYTQKTDVWDFGLVFLQMIFGLDVPQKYHSPKSLIESLSLSQSLHELVTKFFNADPKKRPRAFELSSSEFLATDAHVLVDDNMAVLSSVHSLTSMSYSYPSRLRRESTTRNMGPSRYREDYTEEGVLGKGGFGMVVKARKKLDGMIYAIKKINLRSQASLSEVLKEVRLLSQLSHPAVVRYYNTWYEEVHDVSDTEGDTSTEGITGEDSRDDGDSGEPNIQFATSTGGLDYMSTSGYPQIEFEYDDDGNDDEDEDDDDDDDEEDDEDDAENGVQMIDMAAMGSPPKSPEQRKTRFQRPYRIILYISMEYCEKRTLRDLKNLHQKPVEIWRLFRQILEGLAHIHSLSIVHRDLKPENIFISTGPDGVDNIKIGDFGLATSGQFAVDKSTASHLDRDDITRSIGTPFYAAPEVRSGVQGSYSTKVDMYSLGIIFFEMIHPPMLGMQRAMVLEKLRDPHPVLPPDFKPAEKVQVEIILSLVTHVPKERPSAAELLKSGKLPVQMESETIRRTLAGLADPTSQYYEKMLSTLFTRPPDQAKDWAWEMENPVPGPPELLNQSIVKGALIQIFRRHGALETTRNSIYPRSELYTDNTVKLLDTDGTVVQLPYDLTLGFARTLAKQSSSSIVQRTYTFGSVYRDKKDGSQPQMFGEVDFDIVTIDTLDLALKEAEVIKVLDEVVATFPSLAANQMCFHLNHSDLLQLVFDFCRVDPSARKSAAESLSKLHIHQWTWQKIRTELRGPVIGLSATSVDELQRFDFRDTPTKALAKLKELWKGTDLYERAASMLAHLKEVVQYAKAFGVSSKIYICPLTTVNEAFYKGGMLFSCLYDKKTRDVLAAGGRYDSLIRDQRPKIGGHVQERHAVGFSLPWEKLARVQQRVGGKAFLKKSEGEAHGIFNMKRCDVLVASFDPAILRSTGIEILQMLWAHDISAELARDARSPEDLMTKHRDENYSWIVIIKQDNMLKIKSVLKKDILDADIQIPQLLSWLRGEIRERDSRAIVRLRPAAGSGSHADSSGATNDKEQHHEQEVKFLVAQTKSKKFNRHTVVEQAQISAAGLVQSFLDGPILAIETGDNVLDGIRETKLSDAEGWRKLEQSVTNAERRYVKDIHAALDTWRATYEKKGGSKHAFVYNFRAGTCVYFDLEA